MSIAGVTQGIAIVLNPTTSTSDSSTSATKTIAAVGAPVLAAASKENAVSIGGRAVAAIPATPSVDPEDIPSAPGGPVRRMAVQIAGLSEIAALTKINGVDIKTLEERMRPGAMTTCGMLGRNQSLIKVLSQDCEKVAKLNMTHIEIADHLEAIRIACRRHLFLRRAAEYQYTVKYDNSDSANSKMNYMGKMQTQKEYCAEAVVSCNKSAQEHAEKMKSFNYSMTLNGRVTKYRILGESHTFRRGWADEAEKCGWAELDKLHSEEIERGFKEDRCHILRVNYLMMGGYQDDVFGTEDKWDSHFIITNVLTGASIIVAEGVIKYIREYGFYEGHLGGEKVHKEGCRRYDCASQGCIPTEREIPNPYRVDPIKLLSVISGVVINADNQIEGS